jgi:hypothetical protein
MTEYINKHNIPDILAKITKENIKQLKTLANEESWNKIRTLLCNKVREYPKSVDNDTLNSLKNGIELIIIILKYFDFIITK